MTDKYFILFPSCVPVKGKRTSIIMDLDRSSYLEIPGLLCDILLLDLQTKNIRSILKEYKNIYNDGIIGYFDFLVENEYGFYTKNPTPFRKPESVFHSPNKVISSVLAIDQTSDYNLKSTIKELDKLSCQILQIRLYSKINIKSFVKELIHLKESSIRIVEIYMHHDSKLTDKELISLCTIYPNIILIVHSSNEHRQISISKESIKKIVFTKQKITSSTKETYDKSLLVVSYRMYYEAKNYNTGLHRKVCIDTDGSIKNYLSHKKSYGNIKKNTISEIITKKEFQEKYHITNDKIEKCNTCAFRYMCLSNSDITYKNNKYYKTHSCDMI